MDRELTVKQYAEEKRISAQAAYKAIKSGKLETTKRDNRTYVIIKGEIKGPDPELPEQPLGHLRAAAAAPDPEGEQPEKLPISETIKLLSEQLTKKDEQIKELQAQNEKLIGQLLETQDKILALTENAFRTTGNAQQLEGHLQKMLEQTSKPSSEDIQENKLPEQPEPQIKGFAAFKRWFKR